VEAEAALLQEAQVDPMPEQGVKVVLQGVALVHTMVAVVGAAVPAPLLKGGMEEAVYSF
jgi:hypothetical protein